MRSDETSRNALRSLLRITEVAGCESAARPVAVISTASAGAAGR